MMPPCLWGAHLEEESSQVPEFCKGDWLRRQVGRQTGRCGQDTNDMLYLGSFLPPIKRAESLGEKAWMTDTLNCITTGTPVAQGLAS